MALRWLLYLLIWLALTFFSLKFCIEPECCSAGEEIGAVDEGNGVTNPGGTLALPTSLNSAEIEQGADYEALVARLRGEYEADPSQRLQILGNYYADESTLTGFDNMGFVRAERIAQMLNADLGIPMDKMDRMARLISEDTPEADARWEAGRFSWAADMGPTTALATSLNSAEIDQGEDFAALIERLKGEYEADPSQRLQIYGHYYPDEPAPSGYENMGFVRAERIAQMLNAELGIPMDQMDLLSRQLDGDVPEADASWEAGTFAWAAGDGGEDGPQVIQLSSNEITIRFPFDKSTKDLGEEVESYLQALTQRLLQTQENVVITGHTDNVDTEAYNMRLGQDRADFIKSRLVSYGAPADRITTRSEGESNPEATNSTSEGRAINRRAVVRLMPN